MSITNGMYEEFTVFDNMALVLYNCFEATTSLLPVLLV